MADRLTSIKVICQSGLNSNENSLDLSDNLPGAATRLINYEPSLYGGYRRINGYQPYDPLYAEVAPDTAEGKVLGLFNFKDSQTQANILIAVRKDKNANSYSFYKYVFGVGWTKYTLPSTRPYTLNFRSVYKVRAAKFNFGLGNRIVFVDGINPAIMFDGTNWITLKTSPTVGTGSTEAGGDQIVNAPSIVEVFENHLFLGGDLSFLGVLAHSAPNDPLVWNASAGGGQIIAGFEVVQIKPFRENLFVFGENNIKKIAVQQIGAEPTFTLQNVTSNVGCIARDSVVEIGGDLLFLSPDGFRPVAGTSRIGDVELETVSKSIQQLLQKYTDDYNLDTVNAVVVRGKSQVRFFYGDDVLGPEQSKGIIGGLRLGQQGITWEFGELLGIRTSCTMSEYINREEFVLHGDWDGKVYRQEIGNSFNGSDILAIYTTPYLDFGETEIRKTFHRVNTHIRAEGPVDISFYSQYDWGSNENYRPASYNESISGAPTVYGAPGVVYNNPNIKLNNSPKPYTETSIQGSGFSIKLNYVTVGQFAPYSIQGFILEFEPKGRH